MSVVWDVIRAKNGLIIGRLEIIDRGERKLIHSKPMTYRRARYWAKEAKRLLVEVEAE